MGAGVGLVFSQRSTKKEGGIMKSSEITLETEFGRINMGHALGIARALIDNEALWEALCKTSPVPTICLAVIHAAEYMEASTPGFIHECLKAAENDTNAMVYGIDQTKDVH